MERTGKRVVLEGVISAVILYGIMAGVPAAVVAYQQNAVQEERAKVMESGAATIKEGDLRETLHLFAHKTLAGRGTLDGGSEFPSLFLARELRKLGIRSMGDLEAQSFFQEFLYASRIKSCNVIGYIEGQNKDELVIIGAHYDHVGKGEGFGSRDGAAGTGKIHYGADDNGSGTVATLAVAEVFSKLAAKGIKPKRSILTCFWGAEEVGEIGSQHFTKHPPKGVDLEKVVGYINMDMVGRNDPRELFVLCAPTPDRATATEADAESCAALYKIAEAVNKKLVLEFKISHRDTVSGFERTDGWPFYKVKRENDLKIPVWELFTGEHPDYHTPRDTADKIDYKKLTRVAKLAFGLAWHISEMPGKPKYSE